MRMLMKATIHGRPTSVLQYRYEAGQVYAVIDAPGADTAPGGVPFLTPELARVFLEQNWTEAVPDEPTTPKMVALVEAVQAATDAAADSVEGAAPKRGRRAAP